MDPRSLEFVANACAGRLVQGNPANELLRVNSDSRKAQPGDLFVAIPGERWDGHQFILDVISRGVAAVLVQANRWSSIPDSVGVIEVEDTRKALGRLAARYREDFDAIRIAVGGSNGKTTVKELIASVLCRRLSTLWSEASFNNDLGVPFTLLRLEKRHEASIFEVGTNHPGELAPLVELVRPRIGIITSIGREHLEFFRDLAGVAEEEGTLAEQLPPDGVLIINGDSDWTEVLARRTRCRVVRVGWRETNMWRATKAEVGAHGSTFTVAAAPPGYSGDYSVKLLGRHQVINALLAAAVGCELGLTSEEIRAGLIACSPAKSRLVLHEHRGVGILDDSYNANADSVLVAFQTLHDLPCAGRRVVVLGDMAELGAGTADAHQEVGDAAARLGLDILVTVGRFGSVTWEAAQRAGLASGSAFSTAPEALAYLRSVLEPGDVVLVKASRAAGLDQISDALKQD